MRGGAAKLPQGSKVAPLFYRTRDAKMRVSVEQMKFPLNSDYIVTLANVHEYIPDLYMDCTDFGWNNIRSEDYFNFEAKKGKSLGVCWPNEYFASVRFDTEWTNVLAGRTYIGFVLFVGDLRQL